MVRITDYFYTPKDIVRALRIKHAVGVTVGVFIMAGLKTAGVGLDVSIFVTAIVTTLIWELDARVPFIGAIVCFLLIMVASILSPETTSTAGSARERLAVFAFYFLVIGVVLLIREHIKPHEPKVAKQPMQPKVARKNHTKVVGRLAVKHGLVPRHSTPYVAAKPYASPTKAPIANPVARVNLHAPRTSSTPSYKATTPHMSQRPSVTTATTNARSNPQLLDLRAAVPKPARASSVAGTPTQGVVASQQPSKKINDIRPQPLFKPSGKKMPRRIQL